MLTFRNGQWVLLSGNVDLPGAWRTKNGKLVGIVVLKERVVQVVDEKGENIQVEVGGKKLNFRVGLNTGGIEPLLNKADMPPGRVVHPKWKPRA